MSKPEDGSDNKWVAFETSGLFALGLADRSEEDVGRKELVGFTDGARESAQDWRDLLLDLKRRGLDVPPRLAIADGALGFWKAAGEVWPKTREQRCWVHKTANVIDKLPKSQQRRQTRLQRSGGEPRPPPSWRSTPSSRATRPNTEGGRLPGQGSGHATGVLRLPGRALETPADDQSRTPSLPCATARSDRRAVCPTGPRSRWSSNCSRPRRKAGVVSMATTSCQNRVL